MAWYTVNAQQIFPFLSFPVLLYPQDFSEHNEGDKSTAKEEDEEEDEKQPMYSKQAQWYQPFPTFSHSYFTNIP